MDVLDHHLLSLLIRWFHVAAAAAAFGGAGLLWALFHKSDLPEMPEQREAWSWVTTTYERLFWLAAGLLVMTGVGNLGGFGGALPGVETVWGTRLMTKLVAVLVFLLLSSLRTILVVRVAARGATALSTRECVVFRTSYAGTTILLAAIILLGVGLAHG
jgi:uncharacterized membrane protein